MDIPIHIMSHLLRTSVDKSQTGINIVQREIAIGEAEELNHGKIHVDYYDDVQKHYPAAIPFGSGAPEEVLTLKDLEMCNARWEIKSPSGGGEIITTITRHVCSHCKSEVFYDQKENMYYCPVCR